jgi:hypothetical protein
MTLLWFLEIYGLTEVFFHEMEMQGDIWLREREVKYDLIDRDRLTIDEALSWRETTQGYYFWSRINREYIEFRELCLN